MKYEEKIAPMGFSPPRKAGGDAVEAHGRHRGLCDLPLLESGEEQRGRAHAGKAAGDGHGEDDVSLLLQAQYLAANLLQPVARSS